MQEEDLTIFEYRMGKEIKYSDIIKHERLNGRSEKTSYFTKEAGYVDGYIYRPSNYNGTDILPTVFNFHGGGMVLAFCEQDGKYCQYLADKVGAAVINVDYPVAPEYKYPLPVISTYSFIKQFLENSQHYRISNERIVLMGHSAGGYLAAALCVMNYIKHDLNIEGLIADYAVLKQDVAPSSRKGKIPELAMANSRMEQYYNWYFVKGTDTASPLASPINASPEAFPKTLVLAAEFDNLKDEEFEFAKKMESLGGDVTYVEYADCQHGFTHDCFTEFNPEQSKLAWSRMADFINDILHTP